MQMRFDFNVPPFTGDELKYITDAIQKHKICGDGEYTKKCNAWIENRMHTAKALLTTSCTHATEMAAILADIQPGDEVIMPSYTCVHSDAFCFARSEGSICGYQTGYKNIVKSY